MVTKAKKFDAVKMSRVWREVISRKLEILTPKERVVYLREIDLRASHPEIEAAWENEIQARIKAIDAGLPRGVSRDAVMGEAETIINSPKSPKTAKERRRPI